MDGAYHFYLLSLLAYSPFNPPKFPNPVNSTSTRDESVVEIIKIKNTNIQWFWTNLFTCNKFYFVFMFLPVFLNQIRHLQESASLINNTWFLLIHLLLIPLFGLIIPMLGGFRVLMLISIIFVFLHYQLFIFYLMEITLPYFMACYGFSIITAVNGVVIPDY